MYFLLLFAELTVNQITQKLKSVKSGSVKVSAMFNWAINKKKHFDLFISLVYYNHWMFELNREVRAREDPIELFEKYCKDLSLPYSK